MKDNTTKRIDWVDAAKGVGILLVVYGHNHLKDNLNIYIYAFHMPLFFILAGYTLSTKRTLLDFIVQKAKVLLIPYISFAFYNIIFYGVLSVTHGGEYNILDESMAFVFEQGDNYLWFLLVLFLSNIIVFVIGKSGLLNNTTMGGGILIILVGIHLGTMHIGLTNLYWNINIVPIACAFVVVGFIYKQNAYIIHIEGSKFLLVSVIILSVFTSFANNYISGWVDIFHTGYFPLYFIAAISGAYSIVILLKQTNTPRLLVSLGQQSLLIYGLHRMIIEVMFVLWGKLGVVFDGYSWYSISMAIVNVIVVVAVILPFGKLVNSKCPWLLGKF